MSNKKHSMRPNHGGVTAAVVAVVFVLTGLSLVGVALASQRSAVLVPATTSTPEGDPSAVMDASAFWLGAVVPPAVVTQAPSEPEVTTLPRSKPVALDIPSIGVHSVVQHLGQTADGALETPAPGPHYDEAAWYRYSPTPGSLGPAILMGHIDSAANGPSVFFRLGELQRGDRVRVTRADGSIAVFVVDEVRSYAKDNFPTETVYGDIDHAGLRLITCGGAFDDATGHYLDNIVVFATLEDPLL
jgi:hypothetical protein